MSTSAEQNGLILVVDDDPAIVILITRFLTAYGYRVEGALTEAAALDRLCDPRDEWQGIIVDATLPLMQHGHLVKAIRELKSTVPIIVTSALDRATVRFLVSWSFPVFLAKPFGQTELVHALETAGIRPDITKTRVP